MQSESVYAPPGAELTQPDLDLANAQLAGAIAPHARISFVLVITSLFVVWFAYDGWLNNAPEMQQHVTFNRICTVLFAPIPIALFFLARAIRTAVVSLKSTSAAQIYLSPDGGTLKVATAPWLWVLFAGGLNFLAHRRPGLGIVCFVGSQLSFGLVALAVAPFARGIIERAYESEGWRRV